jgi:hypothetical protein
MLRELRHLLARAKEAIPRRAVDNATDVKQRDETAGEGGRDEESAAAFALRRE